MNKASNSRVSIVEATTPSEMSSHKESLHVYSKSSADKSGEDISKNAEVETPNRRTMDKVAMLESQVLAM
jgi:hypothetical protein